MNRPGLLYCHKVGHLQIGLHKEVVEVEEVEAVEPAL